MQKTFYWFHIKGCVRREKLFEEYRKKGVKSKRQSME
jgi:hypothetical protein